LLTADASAMIFPEISSQRTDSSVLTVMTPPAPFAMLQIDPPHATPPLNTEGVEFLRMPSVTRRTGLARSTIYRLIAEQSFPSPVKLAGRAVGWRRVDLDRWSESRPSSKQ
jgi:prophage regulatory protein